MFFELDKTYFLIEKDRFMEYDEADKMAIVYLPKSKKYFLCKIIKEGNFNQKSLFILNLYFKIIFLLRFQKKVRKKMQKTNRESKNGCFIY